MSEVIMRTSEKPKPSTGFRRHGLRIFIILLTILFGASLFTGGIRNNEPYAANCPTESGLLDEAIASTGLAAGKNSKDLYALGSEKATSSEYYVSTKGCTLAHSVIPLEKVNPAENASTLLSNGWSVTSAVSADFGPAPLEATKTIDEVTWKVVVPDADATFTLKRS